MALALPAHISAQGRQLKPMTESYSQKNLLKNWTFSACLAMNAKDAATKADANAAASAYMEFGRQRIEAYDALRKLAEKYASLSYSGSIPSEFNTMKCIDLFHSSELDRLVTTLTKPERP
ncbi:T6SS amidase immunity protein Tai4 family protein [Massilia genomosp. 1]|uniref:T6SS amidase immunity protein Tai4 family protein n=1 Tax=Massilia genomosp. 1 TaxID=2609280 RepID=UPI001C9E4A09|nr:T6SS amidase immunity protein Tai4 family protein [Massilia genomosp. 1]